MWQAWLIAGLLALLLGLVPGAAVAALMVSQPGVRVPLIGTPFSMVLPTGLALKPRYNEVASSTDHDATFNAEPTPKHIRPVVEAALHNPLAFLAMKARLLLAGTNCEIVEQSSGKFLVESFVRADTGGGIWTVTPLEHPEVSVEFWQYGPTLHPILGRQAVLTAIASIRPSLEGTTEGGVYIGGLFIATAVPFTRTSISSSIKDRNKTAQISALVPGKAPIAATLQLGFPWSTISLALTSPSFDEEVWYLAGNRLKRLDKPTVQDARTTSLAGIEAVRTRVVTANGSDIIEYATWVGGYPVILSVDSTTRELTSDVIKTIDEIEASIRPQTQEELAGAQP